jgi:hypothetical protein
MVRQTLRVGCVLSVVVPEREQEVELECRQTEGMWLSAGTWPAEGDLASLVVEESPYSPCCSMVECIKQFLKET